MSRVAGSPRLAYERAQAALFEECGLRAQSRYLNVGAPVLRTHVVEAGSGEPVVFLHGGGGVSAYWAPLLAALQDEFHLFAPDRPGCGLTERFTGYRRAPLREHAAVFVESLLDELGLERANIVANSMGAVFALAFAVARPRRVERLLLLGAPASSETKIPRKTWMFGRRPLGRIMYSTVLRPGPASGARMAGLVGKADAVSPAMRDVASHAYLLSGATDSWLALVHQAVGVTGTPRLAAMLRPHLGQVTCPTLVVWGSRDAFMLPAAGREFLSLLPNARLVTVEDAGHLPWIDATERVTQLVREHLRSTIDQPPAVAAAGADDVV
jgi:pimeloyl-ACP methyl ester carboxylesterase